MRIEKNPRGSKDFAKSDRSDLLVAVLTLKSGLFINQLSPLVSHHKPRVFRTGHSGDNSLDFKVSLEKLSLLTIS